MRVRPFEDYTDRWIVSGRGVLHLSVLIETMRREGYELQVGQPQVIYKEIDGQRCEPIEELTINVPEEFASKMIDMVTRRKGEMTSMETQGERVNIEFDVPSRGIIRPSHQRSHRPVRAKPSWLTALKSTNPLRVRLQGAPTVR